MKDVKIINPNFIDNLNCSKEKYVYLDPKDFEIYAYDIPAPNGYIELEKFPYCCEFHTHAYESTQEWIKLFPNCCENHKNLLRESWFNKSNYMGIALKVVRQISYTEHIINEKIKNTDWNEEITDYLEYNILSFGQLPKPYGVVGLQQYERNITHWIRQNSNIEQHKKEYILGFINEFRNQTPQEKTDLNILNNIYLKWLALFPFELEFFKSLKSKFIGKSPFIKQIGRKNRYTGETSAEIHTKDSFFNSLLELTNKLITETNSLISYQKGYLNDPVKTQIEIINQKRLLKLQKGYTNNSSNEERKFRRIIKSWLKDEKEYLSELITAIKTKDCQSHKETPLSKKNNRDNTPKKFEDLFCNPNNSNICLEILRVLDPPFIDSSNTYIGKNKGIFPLWIKVLKTHNPEPLIKHFDDKTYKNILNNHFKGLNLSKDASEFRKVYARLDTKGLEQQIKTILSQFSQSGRLGK